MPDIEEKNIKKEEVTSGGAHQHAWVWISVILALIAWALLAWVNGYTAMAVAATGITVGFIGTRRSSLAMKRLAITAIIASTVLLVVVTAYLVVLKIGLS